MFADYRSALDYLYTSLPMFQRVGAAAYKADLVNTIKLCDALNNPQHKFKSIHIAGTNGKGSSSHMIAAILQSAGYKTGLYTSPHLKEFTERIKIDGAEIDQEYVVDFVNRIRPEIEKVQPSFFEITVAMAFDYFALHKVDFAVIETGLGGRLDSTNVIMPLVSLITNIGYDHMELLGDTLPKIATEKAGIIKPGVPVIISERQVEVETVFLTKATELKGDYQRKNITGVLKTIDVLKDQGYKITDQHSKDGIENVIRLTGLKGRWQKLGESPLIICDTGHNAEGLVEVVQQIRSQKYKKLFFVLGMVGDKDISKALKLLPKEAYYIFCRASIPRALDAHILSEKAKVEGLNGEVIPNVNQAIAFAKSKAEKVDFIFIGGSTFVVGEIENL